MYGRTSSTVPVTHDRSRGERRADAEVGFRPTTVTVTSGTCARMRGRMALLKWRMASSIRIPVHRAGEYQPVRDFGPPGRLEVRGIDASGDRRDPGVAASGSSAADRPRTRPPSSRRRRRRHASRTPQLSPFDLEERLAPRRRSSSASRCQIRYSTLCSKSTSGTRLDRGMFGGGDQEVGHADVERRPGKEPPDVVAHRRHPPLPEVDR